ncbi:hypothetical protein StoSoilB5_12280 [Arthrobacter sp. StoSoilB5]|nr:hypothetical protein StoSoilB5_12280 [Arthrobacter sp. StoSoilB5]
MDPQNGVDPVLAGTQGNGAAGNGAAYTEPSFGPVVRRRVNGAGRLLLAE